MYRKYSSFHDQPYGKGQLADEHRKHEDELESSRHAFKRGELVKGMNDRITETGDDE